MKTCVSFVKVNNLRNMQQKECVALKKPHDTC